MCIRDRRLGAETMEVIPTQDFVRAVESLGIPSLDKVKCACLVKVLAVDESQRLVKAEDLVGIMANFAIGENLEENSKGAFLIMQNMNSVSMILMFALTEYIVKNNVSFNVLFGKIIRKEVIKGKPVEYMQAKEFFSVLAKIGLEADEADYENLKSCLLYTSDAADE
eukprot:TRINITY_DN26583_c0_g2_i1.p1 TRINITY_DN26583_c0_g2~~TRINITY_DN26583_c0_g2_i1.p1  ORF type:complete len:167 (+),score=50.68 TRINITY_DN26583_c0_g2_i1:60-560(+)